MGATNPLHAEISPHVADAVELAPGQRLVHRGPDIQAAGRAGPPVDARPKSPLSAAYPTNGDHRDPRSGPCMPDAFPSAGRQLRWPDHAGPCGTQTNRRGFSRIAHFDDTRGGPDRHPRAPRRTARPPHSRSRLAYWSAEIVIRFGAQGPGEVVEAALYMRLKSGRADGSNGGRRRAVRRPAQALSAGRGGDPAPSACWSAPFAGPKTLALCGRMAGVTRNESWAPVRRDRSGPASVAKAVGTGAMACRAAGRVAFQGSTTSPGAHANLRFPLTFRQPFQPELL